MTPAWISPDRARDGECYWAYVKPLGCEWEMHLAQFIEGHFFAGDTVIFAPAVKAIMRIDRPNTPTRDDWLMIDAYRVHRMKKESDLQTENSQDFCKVCGGSGDSEEQNQDGSPIACPECGGHG